MEGIPSTCRICDDCDWELATLGIVYQYGGKVMPQLANRSGYRNYTAGSNITGWGGGVQVKNFLVEDIGRWLHPDTVCVKSE